MIFNKILKGTDLAFDISLEKIQYRAGEIVRGTLGIKTEKGSKVRKLALLAEGKESTIITVSESSNTSDSSRDSTTRTYSESNVFFSKDLSELLQKSVFSNMLQDGTLEILPQNKVIAFDFTLPAGNDVFSSYRGKHANITYTVKATADIANKLDVNKEEKFSVINSNNKIAVYNSNTTTFSDGVTKSDTINKNALEDQKNISSPSPIIEAEETDLGKKNYEARFEKIFGKKVNHISPQNRSRYFTFTGTSINFDLGTIFAKGREDFIKGSSEAKIDLLDHNNISYSPGQTVRGKVIVLSPPKDKEKRKKTRGMKVTLNGIEHAFAQGLQRTSTVEKYDKNIQLDQNESLGDNDNNDTTLPFEFEIPQGVNQSYVGKYSEYFWGLEAKVNIAWSSDINARTVIEIV